MTTHSIPRRLALGTAASLIGIAAAYRSAASDTPQASWITPFHDALYNLTANRRRTPVNILFAGDSHVASSNLVPRLRELFTADFSAVRPGVSVNAHARNGATIHALNGLSQELLTAQNPSLIVLVFGTNEAINPGLTEREYSSVLSFHVRRLKQAQPHASILIVGPPNAATWSRGCRRLPSLESVRNAQREVAHSENVGFWNWGNILPEGCEIIPRSRLVSRDRIHLTFDGYKFTAERLYDFLMNAQTQA